MVPEWSVAKDALRPLGPGALVATGPGIYVVYGTSSAPESTVTLAASGTLLACEILLASEISGAKDALRALGPGILMVPISTVPGR